MQQNQRVFVSALGHAKYWKIHSKSFRNQAQTEQKKVPKESSAKKCWKMKNEQPSIVLAIFLLSAGLEKQQKIIQNRRKINFKFRCALEHDFVRIFVDSGTNLGSQIEPESRKNQVEKQVDFKKKRGWSLPRSEPSSLVRDPPPLATHNYAPDLP